MCPSRMRVSKKHNKINNYEWCIHKGAFKKVSWFIPGEHAGPSL